MTPLPRWVILLGVGVIVLVLGWAYWLGHHTQHTLDDARTAIIADSAKRTIVVSQTDSVLHRVDTVLVASGRVDSVWIRAKAKAGRVDSILVASVPDTVKIRELVSVVDTLILAGDSLHAVVVRDSATLVQLRSAALSERQAWSRERDDYKAALVASEKQRRHWGLGVTLGPTVVRDPSGIVRGGPIGGTFGLTYRF